MFVPVDHPYAVSTEPITGAEAVIRSLICEGSEHIFGYPGGAIMPIYDELYGYAADIKHILTRHEQGAIHAAQGYARVVDTIPVVFATSGPGATNLITGLADALIDSTPVVCITGQVASHLLGTDAFQETDVIGISTPVTKWNCQVTKVEDIPAMIAKAYYFAKEGRPGPVLIDITKDAQFSKAPFEYKKCTKVRSYHPEVAIDQSNVDKAADIINKAEKPFVLWGQGIILGHAEEEFRAFVEKIGAPTASTVLGLSGLSTEHPQYVGMLGMHGNYAPNVLTNECDVLIAVGMRFDDRVTGNLAKYAKQAKIIHLEIDKAEIQKNVEIAAGVQGDAKKSLSMLTAAVDKNEHPEWIDRFKKLYDQEYNKVIETDIHPTTDKLTMAEVIHKISEITNGEAVVVTDVGQHQMVACRYYRFTRTRSNITSGGLGTMGFCLPAAMGVKVARPDRTVIAVVGDGGFQMTLQEMGTLVQTDIHVKILILNNEFLGMVRQWQELFFDKRYSFTEMENPDFVKLGEAYGIKSKKVSERESLNEILTDFIEHDGSYLLEVMVAKEGNVFPMVPTGASVSDIILEKPKAE